MKSSFLGRQRAVGRSYRLMFSLPVVVLGFHTGMDSREMFPGKKGTICEIAISRVPRCPPCSQVPAEPDSLKIPILAY
jgi:hypothetical protein